MDQTTTKTKGLTLLLLLLFGVSYAQQKTEEETPTWVSVMQAEMAQPRPDIDKVVRLYETYYQQHVFKKNKYTRQYKKWLQNPATYIEDLDAYRQSQDAQSGAYVRRRQADHSHARAGTPWQPIGPIQTYDWSGNIMERQTYVGCMASAPSDTSILFCGTEAGEVYKSTNGGQAWTCVSLGPELRMGLYHGVTAVAIHPTNPDVVFVAGEERFYKSVDGGATWTTLPATLGRATRILIHPTQPNVMLWATTRGLYRSTDGGATMTRTQTLECYDIDMHPTQPDSMYMVLRNTGTINPEFYVSADAGATWDRKTNGFYSSAAADRRLTGACIALSRSQPNIVYTLLLGDSTASDDGLIGIYKSTDGGHSWANVVGYCGDPYTTNYINYSPWSESSLCELVVSPTNPDHLIVGTASCYKSVDGGRTFVGIGGYYWHPTFGIHPDIRHLYQDAQYTWIATDGGISRSADFYTNQSEKMSYGLHGQDFWGFDIGWHEDVMVGGLYHNGVSARYKTYTPRHFASLTGGEPATGYLNPSNNRLAYYYDVGAVIPDQLGQSPNILLRRPFEPNEEVWPAYSSRLAFHPNSYQTFYQGTGRQLWKSIDGGRSLSLVKDFYTPTADSALNVAQIEIASSNPDVIYITRARYIFNGLVPQLWKTTDGGQTWFQLTLPVSQPNARVMITIDPTNANNIWIGFATGLEYMGSVANALNGRKVYQSTNGGLTWSNRTTPMLDGETCHDIIHVAGTNGGVYFCTQNTVYYRDNTLPNWVPENSNLPFYVSTNIGKIWYKAGKIRLGTYGRGVWENDLHTPMAAPIARIMVDQLQQNLLSNCGNANIDSFYFDDHSFLRYSDTATGTWAWQFPTGSPSSSTARNPAVLFNGIGNHQAILTVTDLYGQTDTDTLMVRVQNLPTPTLIQEGFEQGLPPYITIHNYDTADTWQVASGGGYASSSFSMHMDNYPYNKPGEYDEFSFVFDNTTGTPWLTFDVAYVPYSTTLGDTLEVLISTDCGQSFQSVYFKEPFALATAALGSTYPTGSTWRTDSIDLSPYTSVNELMVVFRNINNYGNRLYIDNINIGQPIVVATPAIGPKAFDFSVYPNPIQAGCVLHYNSSDARAFQFSLFDGNGKQVVQQVVDGQPIPIPKGLPTGVYVYRIAYPDRIQHGQLVVR